MTLPAYERDEDMKDHPQPTLMQDQACS